MRKFQARFIYSIFSILGKTIDNITVNMLLCEGRKEKNYLHHIRVIVYVCCKVNLHMSSLNPTITKFSDNRTKFSYKISYSLKLQPYSILLILHHISKF